MTIRRWIGFIVFAALSLGLSVDSFGGDFLNSVARDTKRRNCWPAPFVCPDRQSARAPFAIQVSNGWQKQNLIGDYYFTDNSGELSESGKLKIRWILLEGPSQHRDIFVHVGPTAEETAARLDAVRSYAMKAAPNNIAMISETTLTDAGWPADRIDIISRKFMASTPDPRLPKQNADGSAGGGAAGGGSSSGGQ